MKRLSISSMVLVAVLLPCAAEAVSASSFALRLCREQPQTYMCVKIKIPRKEKIQYRGWADMFPDAAMRRIVMRINRRNTLLWNGHTVALPRDFNPDLLAYSPFPRERVGIELRFVVVDLNVLAWGAYEYVTPKRARLIKWGPANGGSKICKESRKPKCKSPVGMKRILVLGKAGKRSDLYPLDCANKRKCGHPMPHYMRLVASGEGIHGDKHLVGWNASHGCIRILAEDAKWLNKEFAYIGMPVLVENY